VSPEPVVLRQHPRAVRHLRMAKGWGGLVCFVVALLLAQRAGVPTAEAVGRGVVAGLAGLVVCWAAVLVVWRQIALAELDAARRRVLASRARAAAEADATDARAAA
jgi:uncharacterized membrane protein YccC